MIVVMTSCAPVRALRMPGMKPQTAPPRQPADTAARRWSGQGRHVIARSLGLRAVPGGLLEADLDRPVLEALVDGSQLVLDGGRHLAVEVVERRQSDLADHVAALELAVLDRLDDVEHARRDQLHRAR